MLPSASLDDAGALALNLVRHQFCGDWDALRAQLDTLPSQASSGSPVDSRCLAATWAEALRLVGELNAVEEPELHLQADLSLVVDVPLHFARGDLSERVTFDAQGCVSAIALLLQPQQD